MTSGLVGPNIFEYAIQKNEFLAKETDLCDAFHKLQKDCDDLKTIMQVLSTEIHVNIYENKIRIIYKLIYINKIKGTKTNN